MDEVEAKICRDLASVDRGRGLLCVSPYGGGR